MSETKNAAHRGDKSHPVPGFAAVPICRFHAVVRIAAPHSAAVAAFQRIVLQTGVIAGLLVALLVLLPGRAEATCPAISAANTTVDCSGTPQQTTVVGSGPTTPSGIILNVAPGPGTPAAAAISTGNASAISLSNSNTITLQANAVVQNNVPMNSTSTATGAFYGTGLDTVQFTYGTTLTVEAGAQILQLGASTTAEAINPMGDGNTITNFGTIQSVGASAIFFQNFDGTASNSVIGSPNYAVTGRPNIVDNFGTITAGANNLAIGDFRNVGIDFINESTGVVNGNLIFSGGNDNVTLNTGSTINGLLNGGGGFNTLTLNAAQAGSSDSISGSISNFQTLTKTGPGTWILEGSVGNNTSASGAPLAVSILEGTLYLNGNNTNFNGSIVVNPGINLETPGPTPTATLEARAQSLPPLITDHGIVLFNQQPDNGTYSGLIQGTGVVTKIGVGTLTLTPPMGGNTYSGGTNLNEGTIAVSMDSALGAATGPLTFNGGTLNTMANIVSMRPTFLGTNGGTMNVNPGTTLTMTGVIDNVNGQTGALTKTNTGTLVLTEDNSYSGGTLISAGTLQLGNGGTTGSIINDVVDNGTLAFNRNDTVEFPGMISGTGGVTQIGAGTTVLTGENTYSGGTTISAGKLQLGNGGITGNIVGNIEDDGILAFDRSDNLLRLDGHISGAGSVEQNGVGTTTLAGTNTYTGDTSVNAGTLTVTGSIASPEGFLFVSGSTGATLNIRDGASVTEKGFGAVGADGGTGTININAGSSLSLIDGLEIGDTNAQTAGGTGTVNVTGLPPAHAPMLAADSTIVVGAGNGTGNLNIAGGGAVSSTTDIIIGSGISGVAVPEGTPTQGTGTVLVNGGTLSAGTDIMVGQDGIGTLTLQNGGVVEAPEGVSVSATGLGTDSARGTINIGAPMGTAPVAPGTFIDTPEVRLENGFAADIVGNPGTLNFNHNSTNYEFTPMITGGGPGFPNIGVVNVIAGTTIFTAGGTPGGNDYGGPTTVFGPTPENLGDATLEAGGVNVFSANSHTVVESGGILDLHGFSQTLNNGLVNAGLVKLGVFVEGGVATEPGTTLTVANNYMGQGGTIELNTFLGSDGSPSDKLVVNGGSATGNTFLLVNNVGGQGAQTFGDGILVVEALGNANTNPNADPTFNLARPVVGGDYEYFLFSGGHVAGTNANNWYLRNTMETSGGIEDEENGTEDPIVRPGENFPTTPGDELEREDPNKEFPIIGPNLATYGVVQPIARELGVTMLGTLHERIGDTMTVENVGLGPQGLAQSAWGRFFGEQIDNSYRAFAAPNSNGQLFGFQAGLDLLRFSSLPDHRDAMGLYFAYGNTNLDVNGLVTNAAATAYVRTRTGTLGLNGYSVGGYWTHYGPGGWYLDGVVQGTIYGGSADAQFTAPSFTSKLPTDGSGVITSLEAGYPVAVRGLGPRFILEPQAQILWQRVSFNQADDGLQTIGLGTTSGPTGRIGIRGQWTIAEPNGQVWQPYGRANFWRSWGGNAATSFENSPSLVPLIYRATWGEVAGGVTFKHTDRLSYYAQFGYQFAISSNTGISGFKGDIGLRYTW